MPNLRSGNMMNFKRVMRHLSTGRVAVRRVFPSRTLDAIERTIRETEAQHDGQIRFAVEAALDLAPLLADRPRANGPLRCFHNCACGTPNTTTAC